jgi:hypothetical protein
MTTDLVARLRQSGTEDDDCDSGELHAIMSEAANIIEQWEILSLVEMSEELKRLRRGEYICKQCGLRKDAEKIDADF